MESSELQSGICSGSQLCWLLCESDLLDISNDLLNSWCGWQAQTLCNKKEKNTVCQAWLRQTIAAIGHFP